MAKKKTQNARPQSHTETEFTPKEGGVPVTGFTQAPASQRPQYKGAPKALGETSRGFVAYNTRPKLFPPGGVS